MKKGKSILREINNFMGFFLLVAFLVTCTTTLFTTLLAKTSGIPLTGENLNYAAKLTLLNVLFLSLLVSVCDLIRRKLTTERVAKRISAAAKKLVKGDFSVRIEKPSTVGLDDSFNEIIDCFNTMAEELSGVEALRSDFISTVSHEIRTPLTVISNYGRLLKEPGLSEEKRIEYAEGVIYGTKKMSDMITNILRLNRLENQKIYGAQAEFDLSELLCRSLLSFETVWEKKGIEIEVDVADGVRITSDAELLELVFNNLLSNAFKFTERGGVVSVILTDGEDFSTVVIRDTGCGIPREVGERMFEKFYQADTSHATEGNGLGLALVKKIVDVIGAEISVESSVGVGTEFTVKLKK